MICSSWPVPSVATQSACVSPRVNRAEPCARGRTPTSATIGRTVLVSRPSMRRPVSRMALRTTSASSYFSRPLAAAASRPSAASAGDDGLLAAPTLLLADQLLRLVVGLGDRGAAERVDAGLRARDFGGGGLRQRPGLLRGALGELDDALDHRLEALVAEVDGAEHDVFGQLLRLGSRPSARLRRCRRRPVRARWSCAASMVGLRTYWPSI